MPLTAPFPFISTALIIGGSFDPAKGHHQRVHPEPFNLPIDGGDNNEGVTVIDTTEPSRLRYCFMCFKNYNRANDYASDADSDMSSEQNVALYTPLSASSYFQAYGTSKNPEERSQELELLDSMTNWPLIDAAALQNTWPHAPWAGERSGGEIDASDAASSLGSGGSNEPGPTSPKETAIEELIQPMLQRPTDPSIMINPPGGNDFEKEADAASVIPDFQHKMKLRLYETAESGLLPPSPQSLELIRVALVDEEYVDLSPFRAFGSTDIHQIIDELGRPSDSQMRSLNISNCAQLSAADLESAVELNTNLQTIYALEMPRIPLETVVSLMNRPSNNIRMIVSALVC